MTRGDNPRNVVRLAEHFEESAEQVLDNAPCGFISTLPDGMIVSVNQTFLKWTGFDRDGLLAGRRFQDLLTVPGRIFYETHLRPLLLLQGFVNEIACHIACDNRDPLPVLVNSSLKSDAAGHPLVIRTTVFNATERTNYEQELRLARQNADELAAIVRSSADAIFSTTIDGIILAWNPAAEAILGYSVSEAIGQHVRDLIFPPDRYEEFAAWNSRVRRGEVQHLDTMGKRRDGTLVDVAATISPIRDKDGTVSAFSVIFHDITERKRAALALKESEARFRNIFENAAVGVAQVALDGTWLDVNDTLCGIVGYSREELLRKTFQDITHPDDLDADLTLVRRLLAGEIKIFTLDKRYIRANGSTVWSGLTVSLQRRQNGEPAYFISIIRDISARVHATEALHETQARLRHAAKNAGLSYVVIDVERRWICASEGHGAVMGFATPGLVNGIDLDRASSMFLDRVIPADRRRVRDNLQQALAGKPVASIEYRVRDDDGLERWIETWSSLETSQDSRFARIFATNLNISERKRTEEHMRLIMGEINHRAKNLLGVVQAVAWQTARSGDRTTFAARLTDRIGSLAASHDLLVRGELAGVEVADLVCAQLAGFSAAIGTRILLDGPPARISPAAAQAIGMALHELATNATKYGALSNADGRVHISWHISGGKEGLFSMSWVESGGPKVEPPSRKGFGRTVIVSMVEAAVSGRVALKFNKSGLSWELQSPVDDTLETEGRAISPASHDIE